MSPRTRRLCDLAGLSGEGEAWRDQAAVQLRALAAGPGAAYEWQWVPPEGRGDLQPGFVCQGLVTDLLEVRNLALLRRQNELGYGIHVRPALIGELAAPFVFVGDLTAEAGGEMLPPQGGTVLPLPSLPRPPSAAVAKAFRRAWRNVRTIDASPLVRDCAAAINLLARGVSPEEVQAGLLATSPNVAQRHRDPQKYARGIVQAAQQWLAKHPLSTERDTDDEKLKLPGL